MAERGWPDDLTELPGVGRYTADAVAASRSADVLPGDTNVRRVRSGPGRVRRRFGAGADGSRRDGLPGAHPTLRGLPLALGVRRAEAATSRCRKQGPFEGSFRQRRARVSERSPEPSPRSELDTEASAPWRRTGWSRYGTGRRDSGIGVGRMVRRAGAIHLGREIARPAQHREANVSSANG